MLSLVNSHAAAALQYGIDRKYDNRTENVIFYDVGSSSVEARSTALSYTYNLRVKARCIALSDLPVTLQAELISASIQDFGSDRVVSVILI